MAIAEISIVPIGTATTSISRYVADAVKILNESRLNYQLSPMGTSIEGELAAVMDVVKKMHESPFNSGAMRVYTVIKIDDRRDVAAKMDHKITSVESKI